MLNKNLDIVILAAGKGTRMESVEIPKAMVLCNNRPLISYIVDTATKLVERPIIVIGFLKDQIKNYLKDKVVYAVQEEQLGSGHAALCAIEEINAESFLVLNCDMPLIKVGTLQELVDLHQENNSKLSMITTRVDNFTGDRICFEKFGRILRDGDDHIIAIKEYKDASEEERAIRELNLGIYIFNKEWFLDNIRKVKNTNVQHEYYLTDMLGIATSEGIKIHSINADHRELLGVNTKDELALVESYLNNHK